MTLLPLLEMDLLKRNHLFPPLFTIINNINGYLNILYDLELLIPSSGTGTRNCYMWRKLAPRKIAKFLSAENVLEVFLPI